MPRKIVQGEVRIIGGTMRGRKIRFNTADGLRPTLDRVRETLFNWLITDIHGATCLDLFAGSGALGFEALSRGASRVVLVDKNPLVARQLVTNKELFKTEQPEIYNLDHLTFLNNNQLKFDVVFLDPPFAHAFLQNLLNLLIPHLNTGALVYVEHELKNCEFHVDDTWSVLKSKTTGSLSYSLLQWQQPTQA